jgi:hypothetical protein
MVISLVISAGRELADTPGSGFYTEAEALRAVNNGWADLYAKLAENNDDYFLTQVAPGSLTVAPVPDWENTYSIAVPADFYRLRLLKYKVGSRWDSVVKMSLENFANSQQWPGYRIVGQQIWIYDPGFPSQYTLWYYPRPVQYITTDTITYPSVQLPQILSYQVAIEIRRKQMLDVSLLEARKAEMIQTMLMSIERDQFKSEPIQNVFNQGGSPWR